MPIAHCYNKHKHIHMHIYIHTYIPNTYHTYIQDFFNFRFGFIYYYGVPIDTHTCFDIISYRINSMEIFPSGLHNVDRCPSSLHGVDRFPSSLHSVDRIPSGKQGVDRFPSSQDVFRTSAWLFLYSQWYRACRYKQKLCRPLTINSIQSHACVFKHCWDNNVTCQLLPLCVFWECLKWVLCDLKTFIRDCVQEPGATELGWRPLVAAGGAFSTVKVASTSGYRQNAQSHTS